MKLTDEMKKMWVHTLTGADNKTYDGGKVLAALAALVGFGLQIWVVVRHDNPQPFSMQGFGLGVGGLALGIGALLKLKEDSEPKATP